MESTSHNKGQEAVRVGIETLHCRLARTSQPRFCHHATCSLQLRKLLKYVRVLRAMPKYRLHLRLDCAGNSVLIDLRLKGFKSAASNALSGDTYHFVGLCS